MALGPWFDIGPADLVWNSVTFTTLGGVRVFYEEQEADVMKDQAGTTPVNRVITGAVARVETSILEATLAQLAPLFGNATASATASATALKVKNPSGVDQLARAATLTIKPYDDGTATTDETKWLIAAKSVPRVNLELAFDVSGQRAVPVVFSIFPDSTDQNTLFKSGNNPAS